MFLKVTVFPNGYLIPVPIVSHLDCSHFTQLFKVARKLPLAVSLPHPSFFLQISPWHWDHCVMADSVAKQSSRDPGGAFSHPPPAAEIRNERVIRNCCSPKLAFSLQHMV